MDTKRRTLKVKLRIPSKKEQALIAATLIKVFERSEKEDSGSLKTIKRDTVNE